MTLLLTIFAAVIVTIIWYNRKNDDMNLGMLMFMFWGASIMWMVDAIFEYTELRAAYFTPDIQDFINDTFLGFAVIVLALVIWVIALLIKDPKGVVRKTLRKQAE